MTLTGAQWIALTQGSRRPLEPADGTPAVGDGANPELTDALEQQRATADILRVIRSSPTDAGPVFETIVTHTARLCEANFAAVYLLEREQLRAAAHTEVTPAFARYLEAGFDIDRGTTAGRAALQRDTVQVLDVLSDPEFNVMPAHRSEGIRTVLAVPILREEALVGVIATWRRQVRPFSDRQAKLLGTFAAQAVIAIENVRLVGELHARNRELSDALEQQTATSEILRVISRSPTDARPVFDTIVAHATRLCEAKTAFVMLHDGGRLSLVARTACTPEFAAYLERGFDVSFATTTGRAALQRKPVQVVDFMAEQGICVTPAHRSEDVRTVLAVPLLREDRLLGVIAVWRREVRSFSDKQVQLLETFADQAVIAIENIRMFDEIAQKSRDLDLANQAKSRFLAVASHDLRQPMHALSLYVGQLNASATADQRATLMLRVEEAVINLNELLDQLLDLSRLEAGAVQVVQEDMAIQDLLETITKEFTPLARSKGLRLRTVASEQWVRTDPVLARRIAVNLVSNSVRYTSSGGVLVGCRKRGDRLRIGVWDTGPGIPDDRQKDVFREFVQLRAADTPATEKLGPGLGLGLAIVARLVDLLGASIELRSRLGRGSMFAFEVPLAVPPLATQRVPGPLPVAAELRGRFAFVIDDEEAASTAMSGLLRSWGCLTAEATDAEHALAQLRERERAPDVIVCDYQLASNENGLAAIARIRAAVGALVPAVVITADTSSSVASAAAAASVPLLHKPVSPVKLRALLASLLSAAGREKALA